MAVAAAVIVLTIPGTHHGYQPATPVSYPSI
jgi:hypothetical protein